MDKFIFAVAIIVVLMSVGLSAWIAVGYSRYTANRKSGFWAALFVIFVMVLGAGFDKAVNDIAKYLYGLPLH